MSTNPPNKGGRGPEDETKAKKEGEEIEQTEGAVPEAPPLDDDYNPGKPKATDKISGAPAKPKERKEEAEATSLTDVLRKGLDRFRKKVEIESDTESEAGSDAGWDEPTTTRSATPPAKKVTGTTTTAAQPKKEEPKRETVVSRPVEPKREEPKREEPKREAPKKVEAAVKPVLVPPRSTDQFGERSVATGPAPVRPVPKPSVTAPVGPERKAEQEAPKVPVGAPGTAERKRDTDRKTEADVIFTRPSVTPIGAGGTSRGDQFRSELENLKNKLAAVNVTLGTSRDRYLKETGEIYARYAVEAMPKAYTHSKAYEDYKNAAPQQREEMIDVIYRALGGSTPPRPK